MSDDSNPNLRVIDDTLTLDELKREAATIVPEHEPDVKDGHWLGSAGGQLRRLRIIVRALAKDNERLRAENKRLEENVSRLLKGQDPDA